MVEMLSASGVSPLSRRRWVPAFAGMTKAENHFKLGRFRPCSRAASFAIS